MCNEYGGDNHELSIFPCIQPVRISRLTIVTPYKYPLMVLCFAVSCFHRFGNVILKFFQSTELKWSKMNFVESRLVMAVVARILDDCEWNIKRLKRSPFFAYRGH